MLVEYSVSQFGELVDEDPARVAELLPSPVPVGEEGVGDLGEVAPAVATLALLGEGRVAVKRVTLGNIEVRSLKYIKNENGAKKEIFYTKCGLQIDKMFSFEFAFSAMLWLLLNAYQ